MGREVLDLSKYDINTCKETRFKSLASFRRLENKIRYLNTKQVKSPWKKQKLF
jgi:hypothetical protein